MNKSRITFYGGANGVTGSNFMLEDLSSGLEADNLKILVDCGLHQGNKIVENSNREPFNYNPQEIEALFVTHAHLDHIGRIPKLVRDGFRGKIYSTYPTKEIAELSLRDSLGVMEKEAKKDKHAIFYREEDIVKTMELWQGMDYHQSIKIGRFSVQFLDAGHILGSAMVEFTSGGKKTIFSGDLGNSPAPLLKPAEKISDVNYLLMESVYGDREHENKDSRRQHLKDIILSTMQAGGVLMIPAFSIERTQEILFEVENLMEASKIPLVPVFLDSPLAISITDIYRRYERYFNKEVKYIINNGDGIFHFPQLQQTRTTEESKEIAQRLGRKIIIAGSGMSNGGRILHHEKRYLPQKNNTLLIAGYQAAGSLGRLLSEGAKEVTIMGERIRVRSRIENLSAYSAHMDSTALSEYAGQTADTLEETFVVMGEPKSSLALVQRLKDEWAIKASSPNDGDSREIDF
ncbi:MAG TPA: MBL fold metallo-hydrolase [Candidatus Vogelbacteria bacterium]|nr:MBL fold metallo-hydrolase [Candidatus Vogelbacteria bacterium]